MIAYILSWVCSLSSITMIYLMGNRSIAGPIVGLASQFAWAGFTVASGQHGLWPGVIGFAVVHGRNLIKWKKENSECSDG